MKNKPLFWCLPLILMSGCSQKQLSQLDMSSISGLTAQTPISCEFEKQDPDDVSTASQGYIWSLIRESDRVESKDELTQQGQIWERDSKGLITMTHLFHREKVALEYSSGELAATGKAADWEKIRSIINPAQLKNDFKVEKEEKNSGVRKVSYSSPVGSIEWLPDLMLPSSIRLSEKGEVGNKLMLKSCVPLSLAKVGPTPLSTLREYRHIDFSDIGDMETDPQVKRIESLLGGHSHGHDQH